MELLYQREDVVPPNSLREQPGLLDRLLHTEGLELHFGSVDLRQIGQRAEAHALDGRVALVVIIIDRRERCCELYGMQHESIHYTSWFEGCFSSFFGGLWRIGGKE